MSNTYDLINSAANENIQEFKQHFSKMLAEKSVDFLGARSINLSRSLVTECDCGCDADMEEATKLHPDLHKIKKTKYGYQLFIYSTSTGKFIAQGSPHKTRKAAEKDAKKFESAKLDEEKATSRNIVKGLSDADGPFTVVAIKNNKVIKQEGTKMKNMLPAIVKEMRKDVGRGVTISIEDRKGTIRSTFKEETNLNAIIESATTKMPVDIDIDNTIIHVTPDVSERIVKLHDELNESNQKDMIKLLESDASSFLKLVKFTQER